MRKSGVAISEQWEAVSEEVVKIIREGSKRNKDPYGINAECREVTESTKEAGMMWMEHGNEASEKNERKKREK